MVTVHAVAQGSDAWNELRDGKYTGSNAIKLLRYGAIGYAQSETSSFGGNYYTKRGHILEDEVIELYETIHRRSVDRPGFVTNSRFPHCGYSPDGIDSDTVLEVKCFNEKKHMSIYNGTIPVEIIAQITFGMLITEIRKAALLIYNPDLEAEFALKIIPIPHNPAIEANFIRRLESIK